MKFVEFLPHLGLVLAGLAYTRSEWVSPYLIIAWLLLNLSDVYDNRRTTSVFLWGAPLLFFLHDLMPFQWFILESILLLIMLYPVVKKYPISALYKGFGYSLLFFIPFRSLIPSSLYVYIALGILATISEISHEAHHSEKDARDGYHTTARYLGIKFNLMQRMVVKAITGMVALIVVILVIL